MRLSVAGLPALLAIALFAGSSSPAAAAPISWTTWTSGTAGSTTGSAIGTISGLGINVSYVGEFDFFDTSLNWLPVSSFTGGTVDNAPPSGAGVLNDGIAITGGPGTGTNTVTFSTPVVNPILAIWSLGSPVLPARFTFPDTQPFAIQGGGPNSEFGGSSIFAGGVCPAFSICGSEGNGVVQINGTFTSISWTNPASEGYYAFTIGAQGTSATTSGGTPVPEPTTFALVSAGLLASAAYRRRARRR